MDSPFVPMDAPVAPDNLDPHEHHHHVGNHNLADPAYWISESQEFDLENPPPISDHSPPLVTSWLDDDPAAHGTDVFVVVDKARHVAWEQAQAEFANVKKAWEREFSSETDHPSFGDLAKMLFGRTSSLFHLFQTVLHVEYSEYCCFLATFFYASALGIPVMRLYENSRISTDGLMEKDAFLAFLHKVNVHDGLKRSEDNAQPSTPFWMKVESSFNETTKHLFLSCRTRGDRLFVALDDDKVHFACSQHSDTNALKRVRHIKDNRFGFKAHTCGLSAS